MIAEALNRTLLLMRSDLADEVADETLLEALTTTTIVLSAGPDVLSSHSGQTAFVTAALLMARCGHSVYLDAEDIELIGPQPPLTGTSLVAGLHEIGHDLLPGWAFRTAMEGPPDLVIKLGIGRSTYRGRAERHFAATDWAAEVRIDEPVAWKAGDWPVGGLGVGALAAGEAFKCAMLKLAKHARYPELFKQLYALAAPARVDLAPPVTRQVSALDPLDLISAGAIGNAFLFSLLRLPGVAADIRVLDDDVSALSNLNRNALLRRSRIEMPKVEDLASLATKSVVIEPRQIRFSGNETDLTVRKTVIAGVDHIPSRWAAQRSAPDWLGIGATEGFSVQVSQHRPGEACAKCLHPDDAPIGGAIPTVAFVSFWSGLITLVALLRHAAGEPRGEVEQQTFFTALRPESWSYSHSGILARLDCPICIGALKR